MRSPSLAEPVLFLLRSHLVFYDLPRSFEDKDVTGVFLLRFWRPKKDFSWLQAQPKRLEFCAGVFAFNNGRQKGSQFLKTSEIETRQ
ncbi:MAG: hypothetical protein U1E25_07575 [Methylocystis sp.]